MCAHRNQKRRCERHLVSQKFYFNPDFRHFVSGYTTLHWFTKVMCFCSNWLQQSVYLFLDILAYDVLPLHDVRHGWFVRRNSA